MKILIGSLLFATAIFINFPELNASTQPSSSGAGPSRRNANLENIQRQLLVPNREFIRLYGQDIEVDIEKINNRYEAVNCRVLLPQFRIPNRTSRRRVNFMTQADFKRVQGRTFIRIVIYVHEDEHKVRTLLGVKLPPKRNEPHAPGDPHFLNPDHEKWFITYKGVDYEVAVDPVSQEPVDITLYDCENIRPNHREIIANWHRYPYIHFGGVYFLLFQGRNNRVLGAALDPFWKYRPGEEFENINPHEHPQMEPQINHSIEQNLEPQRNLDQLHHLGQQQHFYQQHHLGQQQNFDPYQNLHQNAFPYPHQTLDPNQHYAQQGGYQPPPFAWYYESHSPPSR